MCQKNRAVAVAVASGVPCSGHVVAAGFLK
jgi:hypothetical protein